MGNQGSSESTDQPPQVTGGTGPEVYLNVYSSVQHPNSPIYHSGIEISSVEYAYGGGSVSESGVYKQTPREDPSGGQWVYKQTIQLGKAKIDAKKIDSTINTLKDKFKADEYDVYRKNCNHFTEAASKALGVYINYPSWVNRAANFAAKSGMGKGDSVEVDEAKTIFESTKGHALNENQNDKKGKNDDIPIDPRTGKPNPWLKKEAPKSTTSTTSSTTTSTTTTTVEKKP